MVKVLLIACGVLVSFADVYASTEEIPCYLPVSGEGKRVAFGIPFIFAFKCSGIRGRCENNFPKRDTINMLNVDVLPDFKQDAYLVSLFMKMQEQANIEDSFTLEKMCVRIPDDQNFDKNMQWLDNELDGIALAGYRIAEHEVIRYSPKASNPTQS